MAALKNRLVKTFIRKGREGHWVKVFENLDRPEQDFLLGAVPLQEGESPVIGGVQGTNSWLLITTRNVAWRADDRAHSIPVAEIAQVSADFASMLAKGQTKTQLDELQIETVDRARHTLRLEEGPPLIGVWNVLKQLSVLNRAG